MLDGPAEVAEALRSISEALRRHGVRHVVHGSAALVLQGWPIRCPDLDLNIARTPAEIHGALRAAEECGCRWTPGTFDAFVHIRCCGTREGPFKLDLACHDGAELRLVRWWMPRDYGRCLRDCVRISGVLVLHWREVLAARWRRRYPRDLESCSLLGSTEVW